MVEPQMAIACRDRVEIDVALRMIEKAGINWGDGQKATNRRFIDGLDECRLYICPPDDWCDHVHISYLDEVDNFDYDDEDDFEWTYIEASEMFKNQIISERRKRGVTTT